MPIVDGSDSVTLLDRAASLRQTSGQPACRAGGLVMKSTFLASEAAASITGIALPVDDGWTAH
jgi:hypothetical protein